MVIGNVLSKQSAKVALVEDDGAIKQFATHAPTQRSAMPFFQGLL
jgi:hypothetical protein